MGKATRIGHRWKRDHVAKDDFAFYATYRIDGRDGRLIVKVPWSLSVPAEVHRQDIEQVFLSMADEEAEWCAENPDDVPVRAWGCML